MKLACRSTDNKRLIKAYKGSSSVLVIMIMLLMITFGVLSMMSSYSSLKIARKHAAWTEDYYRLESQSDFNMMHLSGVFNDVLSVYSTNPTRFEGEQAKKVEEIGRFIMSLETALGGVTDSTYDISSNFEAYMSDESAELVPALSILTTDEESGRRLLATVRFDTRIESIDQMSMEIVEWREIPADFEYDDTIDFRDPEGN